MQLLQPILPKDESILEICCGNGMATQALVRLGQRPLSMDSDRCDLCQGLKSELLDPKRCFVLDARLLPTHLSSPVFPYRSGIHGGADRRFQLASLEGHSP